ncbi:MAG TPA: Gfo/Idh/MocA family oxidoreductase [Bacteroidales bacterium]|nr:Gfo/Idh/MocA family oxidoreductase [Bacteroidales bacterium]
MNPEKVIAGFIGAGGIARSHAYSLNSLKYYYNDIPEIEFAAVCSARRESREPFARKYGFEKALTLEEFIADKRINTVYILGPNKVHYEHLNSALKMPSIKRIYLEKPVCSSIEEEEAIRSLAAENQGIDIQVGFQYLYSSSVREALALWHTGKLGRPIHFDIKYYHSDYLKKEYRDKRTNRLTPAPDGGAMADLGSHIISMLVAFLGSGIEIKGAVQAGHFDDVPEDSDLFSQIFIHDNASGAVGSISASRISAGTGDDIVFELYAEKGAIRYSSSNADFFEYYIGDSGTWTRKMVGSNYKPVTSFPSGHVPPGWLRAMVHAHYVFLTGSDTELIIPDIEHGLEVQRIVRETADHLRSFRKIKE